MRNFSILFTSDTSWRHVAVFTLKSIDRHDPYISQCHYSYIFMQMHVAVYRDIESSGTLDCIVYNNKSSRIGITAI